MFIANSESFPRVSMIVLTFFIPINCSYVLTWLFALLFFHFYLCTFFIDSFQSFSALVFPLPQFHSILSHSTILFPTIPLLSSNPTLPQSPLSSTISFFPTILQFLLQFLVTFTIPYFPTIPCISHHSILSHNPPFSPTIPSLSLNPLLSHNCLFSHNSLSSTVLGVNQNAYHQQWPIHTPWSSWGLHLSEHFPRMQPSLLTTGQFTDSLMS